MQSGHLSAPAWAQRKPRVLEFRSAGKVQRSKDSTGQLLLITCSLQRENGSERKVREPSWHTEQRWEAGSPTICGRWRTGFSFALAGRERGVQHTVVLWWWWGWGVGRGFVLMSSLRLNVLAPVVLYQLKVSQA